MCGANKLTGKMVIILRIRVFEGVSLREVVSNFRESGERSKNSTFFYLLQKTLLVNRF